MIEHSNFGAPNATHVVTVVLIIDILVIVPSVAVASIAYPWICSDMSASASSHDLTTTLRDAMMAFNLVLVIINAILSIQALRRKRWFNVFGWLTLFAGTAVAALFLTPIALIALL